MTETLSELSARQADNLSRAVWSNYLSAVLYRSTTVLSGRSLIDTMHECWDASRGILAMDEQAVADELTPIALEFEAVKARQAEAWLSDLTSQSLVAPLLEPTPDPTVPEEIEKKTLVRIKEALMKEGFQGDLTALAAKVKAETIVTEQGVIREAVKKCEKEIRDKLEQADFRGEMQKIIRDFVVMPFAVLKGPVWTTRRVPGWKGNQFTLKEELVMEFLRVNPFDFLWAPNSKNVETAPFVIERRWMSKNDLINSPNMIAENLEKALEILMTDSDWLSGDRDRTLQALVSDSVPVGVLECHMSVSSRELARYGIAVPGYDENDKLSRYTSHEAIVMMLHHHIIHVRLAPSNSPVERPYSVGSFEQSSDTIHGTSVVMRTRRVARVARAFLYASLRNAAASAQPSGEVDAERIAEYLPKDSWGLYLSGTVMPVSPDIHGGGRPAYYFHNTPNNTAAFLNAMQMFMAMLDQSSGIPSIASGDMSGNATLGRSFRGLSLAIAAASKGIKLPLLNLDRMVESLVTRTYYYIQQYGKDADMKGDANVVARGSSGYLQKEAQAAAAQESLQSAVVLAQSGIVPKDMLIDLVRQVFADTVPNLDRYFTDSGVSSAAGAESGGAPPSDPGIMPGQSTSPGFGGQQVVAS
jgi:hypothetical protein